MVEKLASSEIAQSREKDQERARNLMRELALPDDQAVVDLIADVLTIWRESWERDTRERLDLAEKKLAEQSIEWDGEQYSFTGKE